MKKDNVSHYYQKLLYKSLEDGDKKKFYELAVECSKACGFLKYCEDYKGIDKI